MFLFYRNHHNLPALQTAIVAVALSYFASACAPMPVRSISSTDPDATRLTIHELPRGFKGDPQPLAIVDLSHKQMQRFQSEQSLLTENFRKQTLYTGCYYFAFTFPVNDSRALASTTENFPNLVSTPQVYCYNSQRDELRAFPQLR